MKTCIQLSIEETLPTPEEILHAQGVPPHRKEDPRMVELLHSAIGLYKKRAHPAGCILPVSKEDFRAVLEGNGKNDPEPYVAGVYPKADRLALFVVTVGEEICQTIRECFSKRDFALGAMVDAIASEGVDHSARRLEMAFLKKDPEPLSPPLAALRYSPGYCGWHISGQKRLFERLQPEGICLRESFLMDPLKSISGVLIAGAPGIHAAGEDGNPGYAYCSECQDQTCQHREPTLFN